MVFIFYDGKCKGKVTKEVAVHGKVGKSGSPEVGKSGSPETGVWRLRVTLESLNSG